MSASQVAGGNLSLETATDILSACRDTGINFIDTSDLYSEGQSEEFIGEAVKGYRTELVIASKAGMKWSGGVNTEGLTAGHLKRSVDDSLRRPADRLHRPISDAHTGSLDDYRGDIASA